MANDLYYDDEDWSTVEYWEGVAESVVRITAAGFAGSLIGLAKERLHQTQPPHNETPYTSSTSATTSKVLVFEPPNSSTPDITSKKRLSLSKTLPRLPPQLPIQAKSASAAAMTNLPIVWSISFILFTTILESCRLLSPTNVILRMIDSEPIDKYSHIENDTERTPINFHYKVQRTAITSFGDYVLGGTMAGLAGAIGQRRQQRFQQTQLPIASRVPTTRFGLATGFGLGIIVGTFQAAIDVSNIYLREQERQNYELRKQQEQDQHDQAATDLEEVEPPN